MDSMIQILEGIGPEQTTCPCRRGLAGATVTQEGDTAPLIEAAPATSPLWAIAALVAGGFAVDRLRRKK